MVVSHRAQCLSSFVVVKSSNVTVAMSSSGQLIRRQSSPQTNIVSKMIKPTAHVFLASSFFFFSSIAATIFAEDAGANSHVLSTAPLQLRGAAASAGRATWRTCPCGATTLVHRESTILARAARPTAAWITPASPMQRSSATETLTLHALVDSLHLALLSRRPTIPVVSGSTRAAIASATMRRHLQCRRKRWCQYEL
jgi:hypothetical protein